MTCNNLSVLNTSSKFRDGYFLILVTIMRAAEKLKLPQQKKSDLCPCQRRGSLLKKFLFKIAKREWPVGLVVKDTAANAVGLGFE